VDALFHLGDNLLKAEKYDEARDRYRALLAAFPRSPIALEARFKLGSALYNGGKPAEAAAEFDTVANDKASAFLVPEAYYWAAVSYDKSGKKPEAIQRLEKLVAQFPTHARIANAKVRLAALKAVAGK
jgi:TolA-binding protein